MPLCRVAALLAILGAEPGPGAPAIQLSPPAIVLDARNPRQQVVVTLRRPDGSLVDVSSAVEYRVEPESLATVSPSGVVLPRSTGTGRLVARQGKTDAYVDLVVRDATPRPPSSYRLDVVPLLSRAGCNMGACHGNINGKGGFRLSLRGDDPAFDLASLARDTQNRRINLHEPDRSLALLKPTGQVPHEGGLRFKADSLEARILTAWIADGARDDRDSAATVARLRVVPEGRINGFPSKAQQLLVTAEMSDGSVRDVTRFASYDLDDPTRAGVSVNGLVTANRPTETVVAVRYLTGRAVSRLAFLPDRPPIVDAMPAANVLDEKVAAKLQALRIRPSRLASDQVFLRRAFLDVLGVLPTPDEARAFFDDPSSTKRTQLVDRLLARPEFADFWALKWADLLRNEEKTMGDKGVWIFQRWLRDQVAADVPLERFARSIVSTTGSTYRNPPASFYRTNSDPMSAAETVGQVFLGVRLQCARCHNHPFDVWTQDDYFGLAAYFANVGRKVLDTNRRDKFDKHEINGDVIIHLTGRPRLVQPRSGEMMSPKPLGGPRPELKGRPDALDALACWLTVDNPQFARNLANRVWFHLMGRGIVEPVDDCRDSNPPSNPELLDALTAEFVRDGLRLKPLVRLIMTSRTYQLDSQPDPTNAEDDANFARGYVKLLPAEVLLDALGQGLGKPDTFPGAPRQTRATQLPGAKMGGDFLKIFGKPDRLLTCECERSESISLAQAFQLINGESIREKLGAGDNRIGQLLKSGVSDAVILDDLTLAILTRRPTSDERTTILKHVAAATERRRAWEDVAWALLNSKEFLLRH